MIAIWKDQMQHVAIRLQYFRRFFLLRILAYYTLENKSSNTYEYQADELDHNLIENNREECSYHPESKLIISGEVMSC